MNKHYSKEERNEIIAECKEWVAKGKSVTSFAQLNGIPRGTMHDWVKVKELSKGSSKITLVHIPKVQKIHSVSPLLVEMRCGSLSFVFNEGYSQESIEATLLSLKKCGLL